MRLSANQIIDLIQNSVTNGGDTIHITDKTGRYIVGDGTHGLKFPVDELRNLSVMDLRDSFSTMVQLIHLTSYWRNLGYDTVGGWVDDGTFYLDPGNVIEDLQDARRLALQRGELAIYDYKAGECVDTSGADNAARDESPEAKQYTLVDSWGDTFTVSYTVVNDMLELFTKHQSGIRITDYLFTYDKGELEVTPYHLAENSPIITLEFNADVDGHDSIDLIWRSNEALLKHLHSLLAQ